MKAYSSLIRLKHFQVEDKTRQLAQIDIMITEFQRMTNELNAQIEAEEKKTRISDPSCFAYSTFAKAATKRRDNLMISIRDLIEKRVAAQNGLDEANEELHKIQLKEARDEKNISNEEVEKQKFSQSTMIN